MLLNLKHKSALCGRRRVKGKKNSSNVILRILIFTIKIDIDILSCSCVCVGLNVCDLINSNFHSDPCCDRKVKQSKIVDQVFFFFWFWFVTKRKQEKKLKKRKKRRKKIGVLGLRKKLFHISLIK